MRLLDSDGKIVATVGSKSFGSDLLEAAQITPFMGRDQKVNNCRWRNWQSFFYLECRQKKWVARDVYGNWVYYVTAGVIWQEDESTNGVIEL